MERVVDPIVTDIQTEHEEALQRSQRWRLVEVRMTGYWSFWSGIGLHAVLSAGQFFGRGHGTDTAGLRRILVYGGVVFVSAMVLLTTWPLVQLGGHGGLRLWLLLLPQAVPLSIPIALSIGIVGAVRGGEDIAACTRGVFALTVVGAVVAFAAMQILPATNQAWRVAVAEELHEGVAPERGPNELSLSELANQIRQYEADGLPQRAQPFERAYQLRLAFPTATLVMCLLALGVIRALGRRQLRVAATVLGLGLYWALLALGEQNLSLPSAISVWAPNGVFAALALGLLTIRPGPTRRSLRSDRT